MTYITPMKVFLYQFLLCAHIAGPMLQILTLAGEHIDKSIAG